MASIISEIARLFKKKPDPEEVIIKDYHFSDRHRLRIRAIGWFANEEYLHSTNEEPAMILFIEDTNERLQEELATAQKQYGLTDRETEVYKLLSQSRTYQDIADILYISLNTVRFHVKNIYLKKGSSRDNLKS
jgi:DNA-binding CsgD family transcriptional regulator